MPVAKPTDSRRTLRTPNAELDVSWHERFLELYKVSLNVSLAAFGVGVGRTTVYDHINELPDFAAAVEDAKGYAIDKLEAAAYKRAEASSDKLLMFMLKAHRPETYADNLTIMLGKGDLSTMSDAELDAYEQELATRTRTRASARS